MATANLDIYIRAFSDVTDTLKGIADDLRTLVDGLKGIGDQSKRTSDGLEDVGTSARKTAKDIDSTDQATVGLVRSFESLLISARNLSQFIGGYFLVSFVKNLADTAARTEVLGTVLRKVAENAGISEESITKTEAAVRKLGITAASARESLANFIRADIVPVDDVEEYATKLARASQDLAVVAGWDSSQTFQRLIINIQQMDTLGLRFMGILVDRRRAFAEATQQFGQGLTQSQEKLAFTNTVLKEATKLAGIYELAMNDVGKALTSLPRYIDEVQVKLGNYLLPAYKAIVDELSKFLSELGESIDGMGKFSEGAQALGQTVRGLANVFFNILRFLLEFKDTLLAIATVAIFSQMIRAVLAMGRVIENFAKSAAAALRGVGLLLTFFGGALQSLATRLSTTFATSFSLGLSATLDAFIARTVGAFIARFSGAFLTGLGIAVTTIAKWLATKFIPIVGGALLAIDLLKLFGEVIFADSKIGAVISLIASWFENVFFGVAGLIKDLFTEAVSLSFDFDAAFEKFFSRFEKSWNKYRKKLDDIDEKAKTDRIENFRQGLIEETRLEALAEETKDAAVKKEYVRQATLQRTQNEKEKGIIREMALRGQLSEDQEAAFKAAIEADRQLLLVQAKRLKAQQEVADALQKLKIDIGTYQEGVSNEISAFFGGITTLTRNAKAELKDFGNIAPFDTVLKALDDLTKKASSLKDLDVLSEKIRGLTVGITDVEILNRFNDLLQQINGYKTDLAQKQNEALRSSTLRLVDAFKELNELVSAQEGITLGLDIDTADLNLAIAQAEGNFEKILQLEQTKADLQMSSIDTVYDREQKRIEAVHAEKKRLIESSYSFEYRFGEQVNAQREKLKKLDEEIATTEKAIALNLSRKVGKEGLLSAEASGVSSIAGQAAIDVTDKRLQKERDLFIQRKKEALDSIEALQDQYNKSVKEGSENLALQLKKLDEETTKLSIQNILRKETALKDSLKASQDRYAAYIQKIKSLENEIKDFATEVRKNLREIDRDPQGKDKFYQELLDYQEIQDRKKEADEELAAGNFTRAKELYRLQLNQTLDLAKKARQENDFINTYKYKEQYKQAAKVYDEILRKELAATEAVKKAEQKRVEELTAALKQLSELISKKLEELTTTLVADVDEESFKKAKDYIESLIPKDIKIKITASTSEEGDETSPGFVGPREKQEAGFVGAAVQPRAELQVDVDKTQVKKATEEAQKQVEPIKAPMQPVWSIQSEETGKKVEGKGQGELNAYLKKQETTLEPLTVNTAADGTGAAADVVEIVNGIQSTSPTVAIQTVVLPPTSGANNYGTGTAVTTGGTTLSSYADILAEFKKQNPDRYKASGGLMQGPGTDTSDNLLAFLSPNEFVIKATSVRNIIREYGLSALHYINEFGKLPRFAMGGLVERVKELPSLLSSMLSPPDVMVMAPALAGGGSVQSTSLAPVYLQFPDQTLNLRGSQSEVDSLKRYLAKENLKRGRK